MPELRREQFDLVITLGDIDPNTLDYIWSRSLGIPCVGVAGNHDPAEIPGLVDLHCRTMTIGGIKFGGFGGCPKYQDAAHHYEEKFAAKKMKKMEPVDVFISHAPPASSSSMEDRIHKGFEAFDEYLQRCRPKYWLHGHLSVRSQKVVGGTTVIGVADKQPVTLEL